MRVGLHTFRVSPFPDARKLLFYQERQIINKPDAAMYSQPQGASYQGLKRAEPASKLGTTKLIHNIVLIAHLRSLSQKHLRFNRKQAEDSAL